MNRLFGKLKRYRKIFIALLSLVILYSIIPLPGEMFDVDHSTVITDRNGKLLRAFLNEDEQWHFPDDPDIEFSDKLIKSVINFEDRYFYYHPGVNPVSLFRAIVGNITAGKVKSGASTISMQVIRLSLKKKRTLLNKLIEIFQSMKMEIRYSKKEILRIYLNNAPYGGNIIGANAASLRYFGKAPLHLTWNEAAILAVLPNSPGLISPLLNRDHLIRKKNRLLKKLLNRDIISEDVYRQSSSESVPSGLISFPSVSPHFAEYMKGVYGNKGTLIRATIDKDHQIRIEHLIKEHLKYLSTFGIKNGAVVVAETSSGKVRAYCGSQDFFDYDKNGQVDGARAARSSGSILKPFLYALAIDEGAVLEKTILKDIPSYFGSFSPSNASMKFSGVVTVKEALIRSLNVPAVRLLNFYGLHKFYLFLKSSGVTTLVRDPDDYGLTLILGGAETRLTDLVRIYRGLGNNGRFSPLIFSQDYLERGEARDLITPEASYLTLNMMRELKRPGAEFYWEQYQSKTPIAWKTGTSYGQRDAWSVGVSPDWTIGVWIGNFRGEGNPELAGYSCAAPLMFDIFNYLPKERSGEWFGRDGLNFKQVELCNKTGFLAGENCEDTVVEDAPPGPDVIPLCPYHKSVYVTLDEKFSVCSLCWSEGKYKKIIKLLFPPDVSQFLREKGDIVDSIPPHTKGCSSGSGSNPIQILYPVKNARILIPVDFNRKVQNITIRVAHKFKDKEIFWYIDKTYKGVTKNKHKMIIDLSPGWHMLEVLDSDGNNAKRRFYISFTRSS
ncbi:MAG: penicillin-binding protein 1C [Candidatus Aminicenantes bacterium]|nr:penicillin-binding protein 1C [Candidatus Aminicenantes bacterium]